ncbi:neprilysin-2-like [Amblyomma americanum]
MEYHGQWTRDLVDWMTSLNLDLLNLVPLATFDPVDMFVRLALDFGFSAIFGIQMLGAIDGNRRSILVVHTITDIAWRGERTRMLNTSSLRHYYYTKLAFYGVDAGRIDQLVDSIESYETEMDAILNGTDYQGGEIVRGQIRAMADYTNPQVTADKWEALFLKYTNNTYGGTDFVLYQKYILEVLLKLLESAAVGTHGIRCLIAWTVFREHVDYTVPNLLHDISGSPASSCNNLMIEVMPFAFASKYLHSVVQQGAVSEAGAMATNIRAAFRAAFMSSSWVTGGVREVALRKLEKMKQYVGSPFQQRDDTIVNQFYESFPDMPTDRFFSSWQRSRSLATHKLWADQTNYLYDDSIVNAFYQPSTNKIFIPTAIIQPVFFFAEGPPAFNYGGLGQVIGHEIMHGYDVEGSRYDENNEVRPWGTNKSMEIFVKNTLCLRESHKVALGPTARHAVLNDTVDSENLADLVGAMNAYAAFTALSEDRRCARLPDLNLTAERLFFVGLCAKWCAHEEEKRKRYAPGRSRCIVPLMNMPEFSAAFSCEPNTPMNPANKCAFWK